MKMRISAIIIAAMLAMTVGVSGAGIGVFVDDFAVNFDQPPIVTDGRTLVPVRAIFEALGAEVSWAEETETVTAVKGDIIITLKINSDEMTKNGEVIVLDVPPQLAGGRTLVPVRAISEAFGCSVYWDEATETVSIYSPEDEVRKYYIAYSSLEELNKKLDTYNVADITLEGYKPVSYIYMEKYHSAHIGYNSNEKNIYTITYPYNAQATSNIISYSKLVDSFLLGTSVVEIYKDEFGEYYAIWSCSHSSRVITRVVGGECDLEELKALVADIEENHPGGKVETSLNPVF